MNSFSTSGEHNNSGIDHGKYGPRPTSPEKLAIIIVKMIMPMGSKTPPLMLAKKDVVVQSKTVRRVTRAVLYKNSRKISPDQPGIPYRYPKIMEKITKMHASKMLHNAATNNFETTMV